MKTCVHETVACATNDKRAVANKVDAADGVGVGGERAHDAGGANVPEKDGFVVGARDEHIAFWGESDGVDVIVVAKEGDGVGLSLFREVSVSLRRNLEKQCRTYSRNVPKPDRFVVRPRCQRFRIRTPRNRRDSR